MHPSRIYKTSAQDLQYRVPIHRIMTQHSLAIANDLDFARLPPIFHNLSAKNELQKKALCTKNIVLSTWELYIMNFFKSLSSCGDSREINIESVPAFYNTIFGENDSTFHRMTDSEQNLFLVNRCRLDFPRVNIIILTRMVYNMLLQR